MAAAAAVVVGLAVVATGRKPVALAPDGRTTALPALVAADAPLSASRAICCSSDVVDVVTPADDGLRPAICAKFTTPCAAPLLLAAGGAVVVVVVVGAVVVVVEIVGVSEAVAGAFTNAARTSAGNSSAITAFASRSTSNKRENKHKQARAHLRVAPASDWRPEPAASELRAPAAREGARAHIIQGLAQRYEAAASHARAARQSTAATTAPREPAAPIEQRMKSRKQKDTRRET